MFTIFSNGSIIPPSFKFTELHALTLATRSYALLPISIAARATQVYTEATEVLYLPLRLTFPLLGRNVGKQTAQHHTPQTTCARTYYISTRSRNEGKKTV